MQCQKNIWSLLLILCDLLWAPRFPRFDYVNEFKKERKILFEKVMSKDFWSLSLMLYAYENYDQKN